MKCTKFAGSESLPVLPSPWASTSLEIFAFIASQLLNRVPGGSTEEYQDQYEDSREDGEILPGDGRHSSTTSTGLAAAPGRTASLGDAVAAKREALASGQPIPPGPTPVAVTGPKPVGFVPIAGAAVHAVGERPPVSAEKATAADLEPPAAAGGRGGRRAAGAAAGGHSGAQTHGQVGGWWQQVLPSVMHAHLEYFQFMSVCFCMVGRE